MNSHLRRPNQRSLSILQCDLEVSWKYSFIVVSNNRLVALPTQLASIGYCGSLLANPSLFLSGRNSSPKYQTCPLMWCSGTDVSRVWHRLSMSSETPWKRLTYTFNIQWTWTHLKIIQNQHTVQQNANTGGTWGGGGSYISDSRQQSSSEDAELSVIVCRRVCMHASCEREVVSVRDWKMYGTRDYKMTSVPDWTTTSSISSLTDDSPWPNYAFSFRMSLHAV